MSSPRNLSYQNQNNQFLSQKDMKKFHEGVHDQPGETSQLNLS